MPTTSNKPEHVCLEEQGINLENLAHLTEQTFPLLETLGKDTNNQLAHRYTGALEESIKSAQYAYDVANNALKMSDLVEGDIAPEEEPHHNTFTKSMLGYANDANKRASESIEKLRSLRQELDTLTRNVQKSGSVLQTQGKNSIISQCATIVSYLILLANPFETLLKCVNDHIKWWNLITLRMSAQQASCVQLISEYSKTRGQGIVKNWGELKWDCGNYTLKIGRVRDTHLEWFSPSIPDEKTSTGPKMETPKRQDPKLHIKQITKAWRSVSSFSRSLICL